MAPLFGVLVVFGWLGCCCHLVEPSINWKNLYLPNEHVPFFFTNNKQIRKQCKEDPKCPYKNVISTRKCWGYEKKCPVEQRMSMPACPGDARGWVQDKGSQIDLFWKQADFGYVKEMKDNLIVMCQSQKPGDSSLVCAKHTRYCRATNIYMNFQHMDVDKNTDRYKEDIFKTGDIGGHCKLHKSKLQAEGDHKSPLQSWYAEMEQYSSLGFRPIEEKKCDLVVDKPVYFIKLDAGINMFHHFCDFVNLYVSQHINNSFSTDVYVVMWDTSPYGYGDFFSDTWKVFTDYPIIHLKDYEHKKVCFREAVFSALARMRYGLYYNMPLVPGCEGSSLMRAFSQHVLHRLSIPQAGPLERKIRVTLLNRDTKYRNILNSKELVGALKTIVDYEVTVVTYNHRFTSFPDQLKITYNSDIFIGMHGAGLTHLLFQPDWAVIIELYNCEDEACYRDLAKIRGIKYMTWERKEKLVQEDEGHHPQLGAHAKFTNYSFDVKEFLLLVSIAADHVRNHKQYKMAWQEKYGKPKDEL